jgi:hypothetical protein
MEIKKALISFGKEQRKSFVLHDKQTNTPQ